MKTRKPQSSSKQGIALVLVLGFLVLISGLILAFFSSVTTDLSSSKSYAAGVSVKQLSDSATNLVMGQIMDGTRAFENPRDPSVKGSVPSGERLTWASQPGLIRTFSETGSPSRAFKLYSSYNMVHQPTSKLPPNFDVEGSLDEEVPSAWPVLSAYFTDLNEPVLSDEASPQLGPIPIGSRNYSARYPIVDPQAEGDVQGFSVVNAPGSAQSSKPPASHNPTLASGKKTGNSAPMPVQWLYVLQDGRITAPNYNYTSPPANGSIATWPTNSTSNISPTEENPIVGRLAFWTDDESAKVNLNTASEGIFWDRPWAEGGEEKEFANRIPKQNEFNRFSGHPALTSLSAVFGKIFPVPAGTLPNGQALYPYLGQNSNKPALSPRVNIASDIASANDGVKPKSDRLYASVDEAIFQPAMSGSERQVTNTSLRRPYLEKVRFFLTAHSRAPEVNLFSQPRITLWPLQANTANPKDPDKATKVRNAKDQLIAFCSTIGKADPSLPNSAKSLYYFQRYKSYEGDGRDKQVSPVPSSQHPSSDWVNVPRNQELYSYLQFLTETPIPGFGGSIKDKYDTQNSSDRDQILTQMIDYLRSGANTYSTALQPNYDFLPTRKLAGYPVPGETQAIPLHIPPGAKRPQETMGFGRFSTITEFGISFVVTKVEKVQGKPDKPVEMRAFIIMEPYTPVTGPASWSAHVRYVIEGLENLAFNGESNKFPKMDPQKFRPASLVTSRVGFSGGGHTTAFMGLQAMFRYYSGPTSDSNKTMGRTEEEKHYPFYSDPINISNNPTGRFNFSNISNKPLKVHIYSGYDPTAYKGGPISQDSLVQTINIELPSAGPQGWPLPKVSNVDLGSRFTENKDNIIQEGDFVRSVEIDPAGLTGGDLRLMTALSEVPSAYFTKHPKWGTDETKAHSLRTSTDREVAYLRGATDAGAAKLIAGTNTPRSREPVGGRGIQAALLRTPGGSNAPGDWDNGNGSLEDGALVTKPDEGNVNTGADSYYSRGSFNVEGGATYSPNRQISSAVAFGSLPTGLKATNYAIGANDSASSRPWQTLLFCPNPSALAGSTSPHSRHHGFGTPTGGKTFQPPYTKPPDHVLLDLFTMPIVEPYAISEPFSTAGKVNLNPQIAPFTYIKRNTGLHAVLKSTKVMAIPTADSATYKSSGGKYRFDIDIEETMKGFETRIGVNNNPFVSASQVCEMFLVPKGQKISNMPQYWNTKGLTGDNAREYPYGHIYPRLTTKSNTFTVHMRVQTLRKVQPARNRTPSQQRDDWGKWDEAKDQVVSEFRGSTLIERYIDPADPNLVDFAMAANKEVTMDEFYRFRVIATKRFNP